jgi:dipeptidyl aminopeptidase/acylaminoacyl peptidase
MPQRQVRALFALSLLLLITVCPLHAQTRVLADTLTTVLPANTTGQIDVIGSRKRSYYLAAPGEVRLYTHVQRTSTVVVRGIAWDFAVAPTHDVIVYTRGGAGRTERFVWAVALDPQTGLAKGSEYRLSRNQGDVPSPSPDGKWVAFARDDTNGVGQSVVVVPVRGGTERVVAGPFTTSIDHIRWTPDGKSLYFGVNAPVACVPEWSCLPLANAAESRLGSIRRVGVEGGAVSLVATTTASPWPGLSPDGTTIAFGSQGMARRFVLANVNGERLDSFVLPPTQTVAGWLSGSTLLIRTVRR